MRHTRVGACAVLFLLAFAGAGALGQSGDGTVEGSVYFEDGTPAPLARVVLVPGGYNTTARADGTFALAAPQGNYTLRASAANKSAEVQVEVRAGEHTAAVVMIRRGAAPSVSFDWVPFAFLGVSMVAVALGGFYVNRRMAETGIDFNKSVLGGVPAKKPFRRRRRPKPPA